MQSTMTMADSSRKSWRRWCNDDGGLQPEELTMVMLTMVMTRCRSARWQATMVENDKPVLIQSFVPSNNKVRKVDTLGMFSSNFKIRSRQWSTSRPQVHIRHRIIHRNTPLALSYMIMTVKLCWGQAQYTGFVVQKVWCLHPERFDQLHQHSGVIIRYFRVKCQNTDVNVKIRTLMSKYGPLGQNSDFRQKQVTDI